MYNPLLFFILLVFVDNSNGMQLFEWDRWIVGSDVKPFNLTQNLIVVILSFVLLFSSDFSQKTLYFCLWSNVVIYRESKHTSVLRTSQVSFLTKIWLVQMLDLHQILWSVYLPDGNDLCAIWSVFQQIVWIPRGTNCAPLIADLFLYCYEKDCMSNLHKFKKVRPCW